MVSFLGGAGGIAFTDPAANQPRAVLDVVTRDSIDHRGAASANDPRVGMVGGSYGGGIQFAAAAVDPRIDTIIPLITWNDLTYSLIPNGTGIVEGVSTALPGAAKVTFASVLFASGVLNPGSEGYRADPSRLAGCPNYQRDMCTAIAQATTIGTVNPDIADYLGTRRSRPFSTTSVSRCCSARGSRTRCSTSTRRPRPTAGCSSAGCR